MLLFILACQDIALMEKNQQGLIVAPGILEFGHLQSGHESDTKEITISNASDDDIVVDRLEIEGENFSIVLDGFTVEANGYTQVQVGYSPLTYEHNEGVVDIYLQGEEWPEASVLLDGYGDAPVINIEPSDVDFGTPLLGCEISEEVSIENIGNIDLVVDEITFMTSLPQEIFLNMGALPEFPWTIAPGSRLSLFVEYFPEDAQGDTIDWDVMSNDPKTPVATAGAVGIGSTGNEMSESWVQQPNSKLDIVWVIDNSGSMSLYQSKLGINMVLFMNMLLSFNPDYQMGFITTDDDSWLGGQTINSATTYPTNMAVSIINSAGLGGSGQEAGLHQLKKCFDGGACTSWSRPDAQLIAIFVSDEFDQSPYAYTTYKSFFDSIRPGTFTPFAIIGDVPAGCGGPAFPADPGWGYWDLVNAYNSKWWSICDIDWGAQIEEIATSAILETSFPLRQPDPMEETIEVFVNGQPVEDGWYYDDQTNSVIFDYEDVPQSGDLIQVMYSYWGCLAE